MQSLQEIRDHESPACTSLLPISVIVPVRNEARNLPRCLESLRQFGEVYVIDSQSSDESVELARTAGAKIVQFYYQGGWPKKRQWALNTLPLKYEWVLLLDADEVVTPSLAREIRAAISDPAINGYHLGLQMWFLGRPLRFSGARFWKTSVFRRKKGRFECRLAAQDSSMADMEIHEHVIVDGPTAFLKEPLIHHNIDSLSRYIRKHDEYSNWESEVLSQTLGPEDLRPRLFCSQAHRGPDGAGIWERSFPDGSYVGLGSRRLAILDLTSDGQMPMCNEDGSVWITYNGEIYNFAELRRELEGKGHRFVSHTDTEVIIHLYEQEGSECVRRLNGMFAFAICDLRGTKPLLLVARDHFGIKPFYYVQRSEKFAFASEIKALLQLPGVEPEIDRQALHQYLSFLWVPDPATMFGGIFKLPAGHYGIWQDAHFQIKQ